MRKRIERRQKEIKLRKNFLPSLLIIVLLWSGLFFTVYFFDPETFGILYSFFALVFLASLFTFSTLFANTRRGFIASSVLILFLLLRYLGVGNLLNLLLLIGVGLAANVYFSRD